MIPEDMKEWIDNVPYEELLRRWRTAPAGSPWFQGETGKYYELIMSKRRSEVGLAEHVRASKAIG